MNFRISSPSKRLICLTGTALGAALPATIIGGSPLYAAAASADAMAELDPATLVTIEEIKAPIIDSGRLDGVLKVTLTVQTGSADGAAQLAHVMPELRTALLSATMEFARLHASPFTPVDVARLRDILTPAAKGVAPQVTTVLVSKAGAFTR